MASRVFFRRLLIRRPTATPSLPKSSTSSSLLIPRRHRSAKSDVIDPNQDAASAASKPEQLSPMLAVFEDMIHGMIVQRCEPEWLPFVPGSSFWVPPRPKSGSFVKEIERMSMVNRSLSDEETMALTTMRGWPSSAFFLQGKEIDLGKLGTVDLQDKDTSLTIARFSKETDE